MPSKKLYQQDKNESQSSSYEIPFKVTKTSIDLDIPDSNKEESSADMENENFSEIEKLRKEIQEWKEKHRNLVEAWKKETDASQKKTECETVLLLSSSSVQEDAKKCKMLTGLGWDTFDVLYNFMKPQIKSCSSSQAKLPVKEQLFITLVKLRQNPSVDLICHLLGIARSTFVDIFCRWLNLLHAKIGFLVHWPDRDVIFKTVPPIFRAKYPRLTCIVDCFEIKIEAPKPHSARAATYSSYKKSTTVKFFIACHPAGAITYLSPAWGGRASDVEIVRRSNFMTYKHFMPGDQILADRGFTLHDDFAARVQTQLITPEFMKGKSQMPAEEVERSREVSNIRIHIERVIGILKNRYHILDGPMQLGFIKTRKEEAGGSDIAKIDKIVNVCAALVNMEGGVVYNEEH